MIATLGLISNSTAVVIGAMIVAPLMDPILSLAFGLTIADNRLVKRSAITVVIGVLTVVGTSWLLASLLGANEINPEITGRTAPNLIDLVIAVAAAVAGAFTLSRDRLSNSIAGVAIAVALVPPLCVTGIGLSLGPEMVAVFGLAITGLSNQVSEGSFLLRQLDYHRGEPGDLRAAALWQLAKSLAQLVALLGLLGLLCIPLSSATTRCAATNQRAICNLQSRLDPERSQHRNESGQYEADQTVQQRSVVDNDATIDLVLNVPQALVGKLGLEGMQDHMIKRAKDVYGLMRWKSISA